MKEDDIVIQDFEHKESEANQQDEINNINVDNLQYLEEEVSNYLEHSREDLNKNVNVNDRQNRISDIPEDYHLFEYEPTTSHDLANQLPIIKDLSEAEQNENEERPGIIQKDNDKLRKTLSSKNKKIEKMEEENNSLKILILKLYEQKETNDNIIKKLNDTISKLKSQNSSLASENKEYIAQNNELNYKVIELNQKLLSKSSLDAINEKLNSYSFTSRPSSTKYMNDINTSFNADNNNNANNEINKLTNKIMELEIENNKLKFENSALKTNIDNLNADNINEKAIESKLHSNEIESLNKHIKTLNQTVTNLYAQQHNYKYNYNNCSISQNQDDDSTIIDDINSQSLSHILEEVKVMNGKIRKLEQEKLQKDAQLKNEMNLKANLEITLRTKENIFNELQITYAELNRYHDQIVKEYEDNETKLRQENELTIQQLNQKNNEYQTLYSKYQLLVDNMKTISNDNQIANAQFTQITNDYNNKLMKAYAKLKEYKMKIQTLKMKIDELHNEIQDLRYGQELNQQLNNMHNDFINQQYNNMYFGNNNNNNNPSINNNKQYEDTMTNNINEYDDKSKGDLGKINNNLNMPVATTEEEQFRQLQDFKDILNKMDVNFKKIGNDNENDNKEEAK